MERRGKERLGVINRSKNRQHLNKPLRDSGHFGHETIQDPGARPKLDLISSYVFFLSAMGPYAQGKNPVDHRLAEVIEAELGSLNGSGNGKVLPKFYVPKAVAWLQVAQLTRWDACFAQTWKRTMAITNENSNPPNIQRLFDMQSSFITPCYS